MSVAAIAMKAGINAMPAVRLRRKHLGRNQHGAYKPRITAQPPMRPAGRAIEIESGIARVRLRGGVDEASLRTVLSAVRSLE